MNDKQKEYIDAIHNESIVLCTGVWGSSKTYCPSVIACDMLMNGEVDKIVIARPTEGKGKSVGYFKGDKNEKLSGWAAPILDTFRKRLGEGHLEAYLENGRVELLALEQVKGRSWDDTFILVDEAEDLERSVAKSLVSRQGVRSKLVITGDINQTDIKEYSGLQLLLDVAKYSDLNITTIDFDSWDYCVRS
jgi:phosphate starvation-inducible PhoH-like protein